MDRDALIASLRAGGAFVGPTPRIKGTRFPRMSASREGQPIDLTLAEWAEYRTVQGRTIAPQPRATQIGTPVEQWKSSLPAEVGAVLKDGRRNKNNVESMGWLFFDVDHGTSATWDALKSALDALGAAYLMSESSTHGIDKDTGASDESAVRIHCYLPLVAPMIPVGDAGKWNGEVWAPAYRCITAALAMLAGSQNDVSTCDAARGVFVPMTMDGAQARKVIWAEGGGLDVAAFVAALPDDMRKRPKAEQQSDADRSAAGEARTPDGDWNYEQPEGEMFTYNAKGDARLTHAGLLTIAQELGILRRQYAPGMWATVCPWEHLHGSGAGSESSTALLLKPGTEGVWCCLHGHSLASNEANLGQYGTNRLSKLAISRGILSYPPKNEAPEAATSEADRNNSTVSDAYKVANSMSDVKSVSPILPHDLQPRELPEAPAWPLTEMGLGERIAYRFGAAMRFNIDTEGWHVWDGRIWAQSDLAAEALAKRTVRLVREEADETAVAETTAAAGKDRAEYASAMRLFETQRRDHAAAIDRWTAAPKETRGTKPRPPIRPSKPSTLIDDDAALSEQILSWSRDMEGRRHVLSALAYARSERGIYVRHCDFDRDQYLLSVENGTLELRTGTLRAHSSDDMMTKLVPVCYDAAATCPTWDRFVDQAMMGNANMIAYLQRLAGLMLTGEVRDEVYVIHYGSGANGKGSFFRTMERLLNGYAVAVPPALMTEGCDKTSPGMMSAIAKLTGARLAIANETAGGSIDDPLIKAMSSKDPIVAKLMNKDMMSFNPTHHLHMICNDLPQVRGITHGTWRRIKVIRWGYQVPESLRDNDLDSKLAAELPGILAWAMRGLQDYIARGGLAEPQDVIDEVAALRGDNDRIGQFIDDEFTFDPKENVKIKEMREAYEGWAKSEGIKHTLGAHAFKAALEGRGIKQGTKEAARCWLGIRRRKGGEDGYTTKRKEAQQHAPN